MNDTVENAAVPQQDAAAPQQDADLNINDLAMIRSIIDLASSRGVFKAGNEMIAVGQTYAKLNTFLEHVEAQAEKAKQAKQAGQADGESTQ